MGNEYWAIIASKSNSLSHFGVLGMKWGVRRYQNEDGTLTPAGRKRYIDKEGSFTKKADKELSSEQKKSLEGSVERQRLDYIMNPSQNKRIGKKYYKDIANTFEKKTSAKTRSSIQSIKRFISNMKEAQSKVSTEEYNRRYDQLWKKIRSTATSACKDLGINENFADKMELYLMDYLNKNSKLLDLDEWD